MLMILVYRSTHSRWRPARQPCRATGRVRLSGWCHRIRDHGGLLFIDLRDHYGLTQVVADPDLPAFNAAERLRSEWVVRIDGKVRGAGPRHGECRTADRRGRGLRHRDRGAGPRPANCRCRCSATRNIRRRPRLKYRFLDLRRERLHQQHHAARRGDRRLPPAA